jgi:uncharacterized ParB-like nuclease family protein
MVKKLNLNAIRIDGGTQPREHIDMEVVGDYAEAIKVGIEFPPVVVFHDGAEYWLADGFHRWHAHNQAEKASIEANVCPGSLDDAKLFASGSNGDHGLRRTNADKRLAVLMAVGVKGDWSDTKIAEHCGVSVPFVSAIRRPAVAAKQQEHRAASATKKAADRNPITPTQISRVSAELSAKATRVIPLPPVPEANEDALTEAQHTITELAAENEQLQDRLAVEAMDASEAEKTQASETIRELRALVKTLEAENAALKVSRDTYQREASELKRQCAAQQRELKKLRAAA